VPTTQLHAHDLEPSLVSAETYVTRRRPTYIDAPALLGLMLVLLTLIPARYIVSGMTDLARPGLIVGFCFFAWWLVARFSPRLVMPGPQPMRWALLFFFVSLMLSYAAGYSRGLTSMEANGADRMMLYFCVFGGALLAAADGIPNWFRLRGLLKVLVGCATVVAVIALVQYTTQIDLTTYLTVPGLEAKGWTPTYEARGDGIRVASTTTHYIELAAFLVTCLPFAVHFALFGDRRGGRMLATVSSVLILGGVLTTISRTGMLALGVVIATLFLAWTWRMRYNLLAVGAILAAMLAAVSPGLFRTLTRLFEDPANNPAFTVRQERYPLAFHYIAERPWLGRGTGTWIAPQYQIMDNQWLDTLLMNGIVGASAMAALHLTGIVLAVLAWRRAARREDRHLAAALVATQVMAILVAGTFDSLSFMTYATTMGLTLGLCGTVWRLTHPARTVRTSTTRWFLDGAKTPPRTTSAAGKGAVGRAPQQPAAGAAS
jgi:O-antigen ligase